MSQAVAAGDKIGFTELFLSKGDAVKNFVIIDENINKLSGCIEFGTSIAFSLSLFNQGRRACFVGEITLKLYLGEELFHFDCMFLLN